MILFHNRVWGRLAPVSGVIDHAARGDKCHDFTPAAHMRRTPWQATCYHSPMERVIDKGIVFVCCLAGLVVQPWEPALLVALLCSVAVAALPETLPQRFAIAPALAFSVLALIVPAFAVFMPLSVYDLARDEHPAVRMCWALPVLAAVMRLPQPVSTIIVLTCAVAFLLSFRTRRALNEQVAYHRLRDTVQETSLALEAKNQGLRDKQDLEVRLATLAERGRIAREIHDNVGHLLTRSIMQVEALQVVHRDEPQVREELAQVGETLHEAMSTVRSSVHNLHDDAFDLETQIGEVASAWPTLRVDIDYRATDIPTEVGYCFIAIVREALSNTVKHSNAQRVSVSVAAYPAFYRLIVHDNGTMPLRNGVLDEVEGARVPTPGAVGGIGLATMADRARALGGRCNFGYDHGFKVFVTIPKENQT